MLLGKGHKYILEMGYIYISLAELYSTCYHNTGNGAETEPFETGINEAKGR